MTEMRMGQVIDALVTGLGATTGFRLSTADGYETATTVWDGPDWQLVEDHGPGGNVIIGYSGPRGSRQASATSNWSSGPISGTSRSREETTQLACLATAQRHGTAKLARDEAIAIVTAVANFCRSNPSLGIDVSPATGGRLTKAYLTGGSMVQFADRGCTCEIEFTITYNTRV